ncbi:MAG: alpha/beta hydrolase [Sedimenticola sp.]|nr:alpha/beta hydrolase [Sedimenticola sp.]
MENNRITTLQIDGCRLECQWHGQHHSDKPVLVLLHEGLGCIAMWRDFPARLAEQTGCPVFVYSRQGYGGSDPFKHDLTIDFMHDEGRVVLPAVLDAAGIDNAVLVGHSDGASIALIHAGELRDDRVLGLVLLAPHLFVEPETLQGIRQAKQAFETDGLAARLSRYHLHHTDDTFNRWCRIWLDPQFESWNIESSLPTIRVPLLAIMGEDDQYGTLAQIDALAAVQPTLTKRLVLEACGHSPHLEKSDEVLASMNAFLKQSVLR